MFDSGEFYEGELCDGVKEGVGRYIYADNKSYNGNWRDNLKNGYGVYEDPGR